MSQIATNEHLALRAARYIAITMGVEEAVSPNQCNVHLVTGAASGIGCATAKLLAASGAAVALADINVAGVHRLASELGDNTFGVELDITSQEAWERALDVTIARFGRLDVLVNNAAIVVPGYARDVAVADHRRTLETNFMGPLIGTLAALRHFRGQGSGHIVTVCSMTSFLPFPGIASYGAAKQALRAMHHAIALEERHSSVAFTIVHPTATDTPMLVQEEENDACALAFLSEPVSAETVAKTILDAIASKALEVFMPPERAGEIRPLGTDAARLHALFDRMEKAGNDRLLARRNLRPPETNPGRSSPRSRG